MLTNLICDIFYLVVRYFKFKTAVNQKRPELSGLFNVMFLTDPLPLATRQQ